MKKVYIIHTSLVSHQHLSDLFSEIAPDCKIHHIIDDSLLADVMENGGITSKITDRMCAYVKAAENNGADLIFNQCSSVSESFDIASKGVGVPCLKVDTAMAEEAVLLGKKIAVIATVKSTMKPSCLQIEQASKKLRKEVEILPFLVDGALDVLMKEKNRKLHNELVISAIRKAHEQCDVIVLAQGSMVVLLDDCAEFEKPILTSPRRGVLRAKELLYETR